MENYNTTPKQDVKATYDPGWNDPPKFSYSEQQSTPNRPRNFLNKRVAFPLSNTTASPLPPAPMNLPPIPTITPPVQPLHPIKVGNDQIEIDSENTLLEVKRILLEIIESSTELGPKVIDIRRRIALMEDMWSSGKLNNTIQLQMNMLAQALKDNNPHKADDIHRVLMVDHVSTVGTWMPGVKLLIRHCIARSELLAIDKE